MLLFNTACITWHLLSTKAFIDRWVIWTCEEAYLPNLFWSWALLDLLLKTALGNFWENLSQSDDVINAEVAVFHGNDTRFYFFDFFMSLFWRETRWSSSNKIGINQFSHSVCRSFQYISVILIRVGSGYKELDTELLLYDFMNSGGIRGIRSRFAYQFSLRRWKFRLRNGNVRERWKMLTLDVELG